MAVSGWLRGISAIPARMVSSTSPNSGPSGRMTFCISNVTLPKASMLTASATGHLKRCAVQA
ncbi:MAG: hypothetical protein NT121_10765 [Chloroflexi bacterium]|nr:hypothetical protein [Chloroflexota bacterium]